MSPPVPSRPQGSGAPDAPVGQPAGGTRTPAITHDAAWLLAAIIESSEDAILSLDLSGTITTWNRGAERLYGHVADEIIGCPVSQLIPSGRQSDEFEILDRIRRGERVEHYETIRRRKGGSEVHVSLSVSPIFNSEGRIIGAAKIARDITERRRAMEQIRESEARFADLADNIAQLAWMADRSGEVFWFNRRWFEYTGKTLDEMGRGGWQAVHHPDHFQRVGAKFRACIDSGEVWEDTFPLRSRDGEFRWFLSRAVPIRGEDGEIRRWFGTNTDVTEAMEAQQALSQRTRILEIINRVSGALVGARDVHAIVQHVIDAGREISGAAFAAFFYNVRDERGEAYTLFNVSGAPREAFEKLPMPRNSPLFEPTFRGEGVVRIADILADPRYGQNPPFNGMPEGHLPVRSYLAVPVATRSGEVLGGMFFGHPEPDVFTATDEEVITALAAQTAVGLDNANLYAALQRELEQQKRADAILAAHARRAEFLSRIAAELLVTENPRDRLAAIFGRAAREMGAEIYFHYFITPDGAHLELESSAGLAPEHRASLKKLAFGEGLCGLVAQRREPVLLSDIARSDWEVAASHRALGIRAYLGRPILAGGDRLLGTLAFASTSRDRFEGEELRFVHMLCDLVAASLERARLLTEVSAARDAAEEASRAKDDFLARLSHELRTPLTPVLLVASEFSRRADISPEERAAFESIAKHVSLESRLIDDLLDLTRITRGKLSLDLRPHDAHSILNDAIETVHPELEQKGITLRLEFGASPSLVPSDPVRLQQVFWNILKNAVKFTPSGGQIRVVTRVSRLSRRLSVTISDTGLGMTPAELQRAFEAFSQGDHAEGGGSPRFGGVGLGLAISRMLVQLHRGTIRATSSGPGRGATFTIELPLADNVPAPAAAPVNSSAPAASACAPAPLPKARRPRILIVEDHAATRAALAQLLERREYEVVAASGVAEAREIAGRQSFDLLISDIGLPDGSGYELMSDLWRKSGLRGIALTGYGMEQDVARSRASGFVAHLTKPVRVHVLEAALVEAFEAIAAGNPPDSPS